ncbi:MAG TPA: DUF402 domain-containing protein [Dehalococcoidia bacterium]|nr:DUF402 domain-containing protein [Dehalococcoidia bacterium]
MGLASREASHHTAGVTGEPFTITAQQYDGTLLKRWPGELRDRSETIVVAHIWAGTRAEAGDGVWKVAWHTTAYLWPGRWYNAFRYDDPYRGLMGYQCHITTPPEIDATSATFVDLGMSLWIPRRGEPEVKEREIFESFAERFSYSPEVRERAEASLAELRSMHERGVFPFLHASAATG